MHLPANNYCCWYLYLDDNLVLCEANEGAWDNEVDDADDMFDNTNDSLTHDHDQLFAGDQD